MSQMTPERWQQIDRVLQQALLLPVSERAALLASVCSGDEATRQEIESLISFGQQAEEFLEVPALLLIERQAQPAPGEILDSYRIEAPLASGGMGDVFLAE